MALVNKQVQNWLEIDSFPTSKLNFHKKRKYLLCLCKEIYKGSWLYYMHGCQSTFDSVVEKNGERKDSLKQPITQLIYIFI